MFVLGTPKMIILGNKFDGTNYEIEDIKTKETQTTTIDNIIEAFK